MLFVSIVLFVVALLIITSARAEQAPAARASKVIGVVFMAFAAVMFLGTWVQVVPVGHVGVVSLFGKVNPDVLREGISLRNPLANVQIISIQTQEYTMSAVYNEGSQRGDDSIKVLSSDTLPLNADVTIVYRPVPAMMPWLYRNVGSQEDFITKLIRPTARAAFRDAVAQFTAIEALTSKREAVAIAITERFNKSLEDTLSKSEKYTGTAFIVQQVLVRNIEPPQRLKDSIEAKLVAEQDAQRMQYILQKEKQEAERKRIEAQGISDFQAIVSTGISDKLLQWKGIEATQELAKSPNSKIVIVGSGKGGLPVILNADSNTK